MGFAAYTVLAWKVLDSKRGQAAHIDEFLKILIQVGQILLPLRIVGNKTLLLLQQALPLMLQLFSFRVFVVDARNHEVVFVIIRMFRKLLQKLFYGNERKLLVLVTWVGQSQQSSRDDSSYGRNLLVRFACYNLPPEMSLLVVKVLQLKV